MSYGREFLTKVDAIADHPTVQLHFLRGTSRQAFATYYVTMQEKSPELLSLLDTIEHYRCTPIAELVKEMKA